MIVDDENALTSPANAPVGHSQGDESLGSADEPAQSPSPDAADETTSESEGGSVETPAEEAAPEVDRRPLLLHTNYVSIQEEPEAAKNYYEFRPEHIRAGSKDSFVIVGFDTEYKPPRYGVTQTDVFAGKAQYLVLSYQFVALNDTGEKWTGLALVDHRRRISFSEFITYVIAKGIATGAVASIPSRIYLVAHYNKADVPAFDDRGDVIRRLSNVRNSIVNFGIPIKILFNFPYLPEDQIPREETAVSIFIRDTLLLSPAGSRSLAEIGKLIDRPKITLSRSRNREQFLKENMNLLVKDNWPLFYRYALNDAEICVDYFRRLIDQYSGLMGSKEVPSSLSSIGTKLLLDRWKKASLNHLDVIGKVEHSTVTWNINQQKYITNKEKIYQEEISWHIDFVTECYHGGRNEQMWFGPSFVDQWTDYDLASAYPTAMASLYLPKWSSIRATVDPDDFTGDKFSFAYVKFKFPDDTRYPTLPVRTQNGIVFPLEGHSYCCTPEIELARSLNCEIDIRHGVIIDVDRSVRPFFDFLAETIKQRTESKTKIENAFWKELTNSCYGKTAQGLRNKRVFNVQRQKGQQLPESQITNPYYAAYITSFVRAVVGEIINNIPADKMIFSVTTDGFITNATDEQIDQAKTGLLCQRYSQLREQLTGNPSILTEKHSVQRLLGWKTRGQATLIAGDKQAVPKHVLARGGIQTPPVYDTVEAQNDFIVTLFIRRRGNTKMNVDMMTSLRDMVLFHADLVRKKSVRRINMEYDFKRRPHSAVQSQFSFNNQSFSHLAFSTKPWATVEDFKQLRSLYDVFIKDPERRCMKTVDDYALFAEYFDANWVIEADKRRYMRKNRHADLSRLKRDLCRAFAHHVAGFDACKDISAAEFAELVKRCGFSHYEIDVKRHDVENAHRNPFEPHTTPRTARVLEIIEQVKQKIPSFDPTILLAGSRDEELLALALERECPFTAELAQPIN